MQVIRMNHASGPPSPLPKNGDPPVAHPTRSLSRSLAPPLSLIDSLAYLPCE